MYYSQPPRPQSPRTIQLHDPSAPWSRLQHPILSQQGPQPQQGQVGVPPQSPGYGLVQYTNGTAHHHNPNLPQHHHHHQSLNTFPIVHYQSPSGAHAQPHRQTSSPPPPPIPPHPKHWQSQLDHADACRKAGAPHARARTAASNTRSTTKSVIAITDPNRVTPKPENATAVNGLPKDTDGPRSESDAAAAANDHPSSTVAPVASSPPPRPTAARKAESSWSALDLGGMRLKNIAPQLFKFNYLTTLYLNHNQLTSVTPAISQLRHLTVLDLSCNQLDTVPPEMGMCTSLEHLWLFDNNIETLPPEMGSLHQLKLIGIEGNPLQPSLAQIVREKGTPALIAYLRDSCPVPMPPPERQWRNLQSDADRRLQDSDPSSETFTLLTYNILCEKAATSAMYGYTPSWALSWNYRKELILTEIINYEADFLCLQEVDSTQYDDYFSPNLAAHQYEGIWAPKGRARNLADSERRSVDGCATFFKSAKYRLIKQVTIDYAQVAIQREDFTKNNDMFDRVLARDHMAIVALLENRQTGSRLIVSNTHLEWNPAFRDVKLIQTGILLDELRGIADWFARYPSRQPEEAAAESLSDDPSKPRVPDPLYSDGSKIPLIVAGDFNSIPASGVYEFLSDGRVPSNHPDFMDYVYGKFTADGLHHDFGLRSAYAGVGEIPVTNYTPSFRDGIDYIWHSVATLGVNAVLGEVDQEYLSKVVGFPNAHFPSDHVCVMAEFRVKKEPTGAGARHAPLFNVNHER